METRDLSSVKTDYNGEMIFFNRSGVNGAVIIVQNLKIPEGNLKPSLEYVFGAKKLESSIYSNPTAHEKTTTVFLCIRFDDPDDIHKSDFVLEHTKPYFNKALELYIKSIPIPQ